MQQRMKGEHAQGRRRPQRPNIRSAGAPRRNIKRSVGGMAGRVKTVGKKCIVGMSNAVYGRAKNWGYVPNLPAKDQNTRTPHPNAFFF